MSPKAQNEAIAGFCGFRRVTNASALLGGRHVRWERAEGEWINTRAKPPNYVGSLDEMHGAEKMLTDEQYFNHTAAHHEDFSYNGWLDRITGNATPVDRPVRYKSATAAQRAEAFLRALDLWDDTK
jgi:hypothetical protein